MRFIKKKVSQLKSDLRDLRDLRDARISQSQTSVRSDGGGGGGLDSPDPPPRSATEKRLQLSKESHSKKEQ